MMQMYVFFSHFLSSSFLYALLPLSPLMLPCFYFPLGRLFMEKRITFAFNKKIKT